MNYGFIKVACATPEIKVADCIYNSEQIISQINIASQRGASLVVFPELCVTGYTCGDLFFQRFLIDHAEQAVVSILSKTRDLNIISIIGVPIALDDALYNCAAVIYHGKLLGIVPKTNIPNYNEFYELRHFTSGKGVKVQISYAQQRVLMSDSLVFACNQMRDFKFGVELCEDLWVAQSPSLRLATSAKATVIANLSAGNEVIGKSNYRRDLVRMQSGKLCCAYLYASAGMGESSTDAVFSGHNIISENATILAESKKYTTGVVCADIDVERISAERRRSNTFTSEDCSDDSSDYSFTTINFDFTVRQTKLERKFERHPFVPSEKVDLDARCEEILSMQALGLVTRMKAAHTTELVLGMSGGLDSTLALIVSIKALDMLSLPHKNLHTVTMPCFGTTYRTKSNAEKLSVAYNTHFSKIDITKAVKQHFADIKHDEKVTDVTYENSQARERTQILMDLSNKYSALVVGTGDLSELALGWATYNGDHMSMYGVNSSIPKTLVRFLVKYESEHSNETVAAILRDILSTPVSPELLPPDPNGDIAQKTEEVVGPYELHDFFLYYFFRFSFSPDKIFYLALRSFDGVYDRYTIKTWLQKFFARFFTQQFKRSCMPDGPKVGTVTLSPRSDFRMPSDAQVRLWLDKINEL